jgi:Flp pilus assembly protein TadB
MVYLGTDTFAHGPAMTSDSGGQTVSVPGLLAAGAWTVGLIIGLIAIAAGHDLLAGVALVLAIVSPWFGLAWVSHNQRSDMRRQRSAARANQAPSYAGGWPGLPVSAR